MQTNKKLMSRAEAIAHLTHAWGFTRSPITLSKWASAGTGPPFRKLGRYTYYSKADVDHWMQSRLGPRKQSLRAHDESTSPSPSSKQTVQQPEA